MKDVNVRPVIKFLHRYKIRPKTLFDIGAGGANEANKLKREYPDLKVYGCEPYEPNRRENEKRGYPGPLYPVAIGEHGVALPMYATKLVSPNASVSFFRKHENERVVGYASRYPLDHLDRLAGCPEDILIWMDIEGWELEALRSGEALMSSGRVLALNLEVRKISPTFGWPNVNDLKSYLSEFGYQSKIKHTPQGNFHDLIFIRSKDSK